MGERGDSFALFLGVVMPVPTIDTEWQGCTADDVNRIWSMVGQVNRLDDNHDGAPEGVLDPNLDLSEHIIDASAEVEMALLRRYPSTSYRGTGTPPANTPRIIRRFCALKTSCNIAWRRGMSPPMAMMQACQRLEETLQKVMDGEIDLPGVAQGYGTGPDVSNYRVDGRYRSAKVRRIGSTSSNNDSPTPEQGVWWDAFWEGTPF